MPQDYLDGLERVDKKRLGEKMCPICAERFLDGKQQTPFLGRELMKCLGQIRIR